MGPEHGIFVRNHWYAAARSGDIGEAMFTQRVLGEPLVIFRAADGSVAALLDQCPHRLAPLSLGECANGRIRCGYHGLEFDSAGRCVRAPGQSRIPPNARVPSYRAVERFGFVFLWMGDQELADERLLPKIERYDAPGWNVVGGGYQLHRTGYLNIVENLMDPAHTSFVHKQTIANPLAEDEPVHVDVGDDHVVAYRWLENTQPSPNDRRGKSVSHELVDRGQFFYYYPPSVSRVDVCVMAAGMEKSEQNMDSGTRTLSYKFVTPESDRTTHLFWMHVRNYRLGDEEFDRQLRANLEKTFWEDNDVCAAVQSAQDRVGKRQLAGLAIDRAPRLAVKMIERQIQAESAST